MMAVGMTFSVNREETGLGAEKEVEIIIWG
jgi:hypothetical protein